MPISAVGVQRRAKGKQHRFREKTFTNENFVDQPVIITKKHKELFIFSLFKKNSYPFFPIFNICCVDLIDSLTELCPMCLTGPLGTTPHNFIYEHHHHSHQCPQIHKYKYKYRTPGNDQISTTITVSRTSVLKCTKNEYTKYRYRPSGITHNFIPDHHCHQNIHPHQFFLDI